MAAEVSEPVWLTPPTQAMSLGNLALGSCCCVHSGRIIYIVQTVNSAVYNDDLTFRGAGRVLLVTDIERSPLPSSLRDVLAQRFLSNCDSEAQMFNIAGQPVSMHADFRLVLSSSLPLSVRGIHSSQVLLLLQLAL